MLDLDMTPYAAFVWPAWGVSALVLAALIVRAVIASRKWKRELERLEAEDAPPPQATLDAAPRADGPQVVRSTIGPKE
ncbi:heme exporter protein CcmD [Brevundimonas mediterranea]|uniref:Heme exporter protein D n=1 Tax=Brevundimonas mediterranea TaxID=74329 RepID=A0A7W6A392_9CAUL|nr:heme exporter protein CcmD [Brevundimonas mediterranea]MBB3872429.1 heme exporter protein D [Brevundimonas mediterranea]